MAPLLLQQIGVLTRKNLWLIFSRKSRMSTIWRCFYAPVLVAIYLCFIFRAYFPKATYGISSPHDVRNLNDAMGYAATVGKRDRLILVNVGPRGGDIDRLLNLVAETPKAAGKNITITYEQDDLIASCRSGLQGVTKCFSAAVFYSSPTEGGIWNYTLRGDAALGLSTVDVRKATNDAQVYILPLQHAIDSAIASLNSSGTSVSLPSKIQEYPFTGETEKEWKDTIRKQLIKNNTNFAAVVWYLGLIGVAYQLVGLMAKERESEMSDLLESMMPNVRRWEPQFARLISYHLAFTIAYAPGWIIMGIIAKIGLLRDTSGGILVIGFILAGLSLVSFSILGASFFKRAQLSGITVVVVFLILGIITQIMSKKMSTATVAILGALFTPMAFVNFIIGCTRFELQDRAANLVRSPPGSPWAVPGIAFWVFFILQIICYPLLAACIERTFYGTAASRSRRSMKQLEGNGLTPVTVTDFTKIYQPHPILRLFLAMFRVKPEPVVAVKGLNLSARSGEIMVLVGANGCGKSTTLNAIAGLGDITSGSINVDGAGGIGLCPQKNVLWNSLSVKQHAQIFNGLKTSTPEGREDIDALITTCGLKEKTNTPSRNLSGGQKRKLQLIMMLTGGPRTCCVDEVSGGLDPLSRRSKFIYIYAELV
jgi:ATP-binding cassette subfamily A (ABC1) protein 3